MSVIDDLVTSSRCLGENTTTTTMEEKKTQHICEQICQMNFDIQIRYIS